MKDVSVHALVVGYAGKRVRMLFSYTVHDGIFVQGYEDPYVPQTCEELLKWKYAHLNSVDFKLSLDREGQLPHLFLHCAHAYMSPAVFGAAVIIMQQPSCADVTVWVT